MGQNSSARWQFAGLGAGALVSLLAFGWALTPGLIVGSDLDRFDAWSRKPLLLVAGAVFVVNVVVIGLSAVARQLPLSRLRLATVIATALVLLTGGLLVTERLHPEARLRAALAAYQPISAPTSDTTSIGARFDSGDLSTLDFSVPVAPDPRGRYAPVGSRLIATKGTIPGCGGIIGSLANWGRGSVPASVRGGVGQCAWSGYRDGWPYLATYQESEDKMSWFFLIEIGPPGTI